MAQIAGYLRKRGALRLDPHLRGWAVPPSDRRKFGKPRMTARLINLHQHVAQVLDRVDAKLSAGLQKTHQYDRRFTGVLRTDVHPILPTEGHAPKRAFRRVVGDVGDSAVEQVIDPISNFLLENVEVRVIEAFNERLGVTQVNPDPGGATAMFTDSLGLVFFDEFTLAAADVGFIEDSEGRAMLEPFDDSDQAIVTLEVSAPGFSTVLVDVPLSWEQPDGFVPVPFN